MRFKGLDLNLLVAFEALIELRNVSRAADRLALSQPAASAALFRLREFFGDPLLTSQGKRMYVTPVAEALLPQVRACLRAAEIVVANPKGFDPATTRRTFRIIASDYFITAVLVDLARELVVAAPGVRFDFILPDNAAVDSLDRGEMDLFISPPEFLSNTHPAELLFEETHVVAGWSENPHLRGPLTEAQFLTAPHVTVAISSQRTKTFAERHLDEMRRPREVVATACSFTLVPWLLIGTQRLAVMHERLARTFARHLPITTAPMPFDFPPMREMAQYHETRVSDEGLRWLIDQIRNAAAAVAA